MSALSGGRALLLWGPVVLYGAGIAWLSHQPSLTPPLGLPDWPMHIAEYAGLGALTARALRRTKTGLGPGAAAAGLAACALFGVIDEWHQSFVPGRHASAGDVLADVTGAGLALTGLMTLIGRPLRARDGTPAIEIRLFGRQACHLCDEAARVIDDVTAPDGVRIDGVHVEKVDVDADPVLARTYGGFVPVVTINGRRHAKYRVEPDRLRRVLASLGMTGRR